MGLVMLTNNIVSNLWRLADCPPEMLNELILTGDGPVSACSFPVDAVAQSTIALVGLAAAEIWRMRSGERQTVTVDARHAAAEFRSERLLRLKDSPRGEQWDAIAGAYPCGDDRWVRIHTNFTHHRDGILRLLGCANERSEVAAALRNWSADDVATTVSDAGFLCVLMRTPEEWRAHPQGRAVRTLPLFTIEKIGEAAPEPLPVPLAVPLPEAKRPLSNLRILDLTRVIAGPVAGRALAAHGADVLRLIAPHLPNIATSVMDGGRGKRSAFLDLDKSADIETMNGLIKNADVFLQGYRPGALAGKGFGPARAIQLRPGLIYASLSAYGHIGPWANRRGFDSLVQTASGLNHEEAEAFGDDAPRALPCQALDHGAGYLLAFAIMAALIKRASVGGSWHVRVSLAQTGHWLQSLGRVDIDAPDFCFDDVQDLLETTPSGFGDLTAVKHAGILSATPARWEKPSVPFGADQAAWI